MASVTAIDRSARSAALVSIGVKSALLTWHVQELALFAIRSHRKIGRGFVMVASDDERPIYVNWTIGAPLPLHVAVNQYDPEHEALIDFEDDGDEESVTFSCVTIAGCH